MSASDRHLSCGYAGKPFGQEVNVNMHKRKGTATCQRVSVLASLLFTPVSITKKGCNTSKHYQEGMQHQLYSIALFMTQMQGNMSVAGLATPYLSVCHVYVSCHACASGVCACFFLF